MPPVPLRRPGAAKALAKAKAKVAPRPGAKAKVKAKAKAGGRARARGDPRRRGKGLEFLTPRSSKAEKKFWHEVCQRKNGRTV